MLGRTLARDLDDDEDVTHERPRVGGEPSPRQAVTALTEIRLVVFDFDGVFSDNRVWTNDRGEESVACTRADTVGLRRLDDVGVDYLISLRDERRRPAPARARCASSASGDRGQAPVLREQLERRGIAAAETAYLGNDINDAECLREVGLPVVPADAWPEVVPFAKLVLGRSGGRGCVREFCDALWTASGPAI